MDFDLDALIPTFLAQAQEGLSTAEQRLVVLEENPGDAESLREVFRAVHTLTGDAGSMGFAALAALAHEVEDVLDQLREDQRELTGEGLTLLLEAVDALRDRVAAAAAGRDGAVEAHGELLRRLHEGDAGEVEPLDGAGIRTKIAEVLESGTMRVAIDKLDSLLR